MAAPDPDGIARVYLPRPLLSAVARADEETVLHWLLVGADPNCRTPRGTPAIVRAVRSSTVEFAVVKALLDHGADPRAADAGGLTALDHARRRLLKFEGRPRKAPRRSPSLTPGGELRLPPHEWEFIDALEREHPGFAEDYLAERRRAAERTFDTRGNLERIVALLEQLARE